eukprot:365091-Chlamydomonas_euryale.AAC.19
MIVPGAHQCYYVTWCAPMLSDGCTWRAPLLPVMSRPWPWPWPCSSSRHCMDACIQLAGVCMHCPGWPGLQDLSRGRRRCIHVGVDVAV